jgi:hypothetical protein
VAKKKKNASAPRRKVLSDVQIQLGMCAANLDEAHSMYLEAYAELTFWKAQAEHFRAQLLEHLRARARRER